MQVIYRNCEDIRFFHLSSNVKTKKYSLTYRVPIANGNLIKIEIITFYRFSNNKKFFGTFFLAKDCFSRFQIIPNIIK